MQTFSLDDLHPFKEFYRLNFYLDDLHPFKESYRPRLVKWFAFSRGLDWVIGEKLIEHVRH